VWIIISGVLAFTVNLSIFLSLRNVTPVTYQIVGQLKTISILVGSFLLFGQQMETKNLFSMVLTVMGVFYYTYSKLQVQKEVIEEEEKESLPDTVEIKEDNNQDVKK